MRTLQSESMVSDLTVESLVSFLNVLKHHLITTKQPYLILFLFSLLKCSLGAIGRPCARLVAVGKCNQMCFLIMNGYIHIRVHVDLIGVVAEEMCEGVWVD